MAGWNAEAVQPLACLGSACWFATVRLGTGQPAPNRAVPVKMLLSGFEALGKFLVPRVAAEAWGRLRRWWHLRGTLALAVRSASKAYPSHADLLNKFAVTAALRREADALARPGDGADRRRLAQALRTASSRGLEPGDAEALAAHLLASVTQRMRSDAGVVGQETLRRVEKLAILSDPTPTVAEAIALVRAAARADFTAFRNASLAFGGARVELPLRKVEDEKGRGPLVSLEAAAEDLSGLSVLEGGPGSGKTTTLVQLGDVICDRRPDAAAVLASAPEWAVSSARDDLLAHCASKDAFVERGATAHHLQSLARDGRLVILLDGWNEVPPASSAGLMISLGKLRREFPSLRLLVASRSATWPAKADAVLRIERLTEPLRDDIVERTVLPDDDLRKEVLHRDAALDEITRTPLYLAAFLSAPADAAPVRGELLQHLISKHEHPTGELPFRQLVGAFRPHYLQALALAAVEAGSTVLPQEDARRAVSGAARALAAEGQIGSTPEPEEVLTALTAQHLLIRSSEQAGSNYSFPHQEFRDWYASFAVEKHLLAGSPLPLSSPLADIVDTPTYEGALLFAAERLSRDRGRGAAAVSKLIVGTLRIDPMLGAAILRRSDPLVWEGAAEAVLNLAQCWHRFNQVDRGFGFMLATGREEFCEEVWRFAASPDQQIRLKALRAAPQFALVPSTFGDNLLTRARALSDGSLRDLVVSLVMDGSSTGQRAAVEIVQGSVSAELRAEVALSLAWRRSRRLLTTLAVSFTDEDWDACAPHTWLTPADFPEELGTKLVQAKIRLSQNEPRPVRRVAALLDLVALQRAPMRPVLEEIEAFTFDPSAEGGFPIIEAAARLDAGGVGEVLRRRLARGLPVGRWAAPLTIGPASDAERDALLERLVAGKLLSQEERRAAARLLADEQVAALFDRLLMAWSTGDVRNDAWRARVRAIEDAVSALPTAAVARVLARRAPSAWEHAAPLVRPLTRIFSPERSGGLDAGSMPEASPDECAAVLAVAEHWAASLLASDDGREVDGAQLAGLVGSLRLARGVDLIVHLLHHDLDRWRRARMEPRVPGQPIRSWGPPVGNYRLALAAIGGEAAASAAMILLDDPDFCVEAAEVLRACARERQLSSVPLNWIDFAAAAERQQASQVLMESPHPYAAPILRRIDAVDVEGGGERAVARAVDLAAVAAGLPCGARASDVLAVLAIPHGRGGSSYARVRGFASLVMQGHVLPGERLAGLCEEAAKTWQEQQWGDRLQRFHLVDQWLSLLAFSDTPLKVLPILFELGGHISPWMLRQTVEALGRNPQAAAGSALVALGEALPGLATRDDGWLRAVALHWRSLPAASALLRAVTGPAAIQSAWLWRGESDPLLSAVADATAAHDTLRDQLLSMARAGNEKAASLLCSVAAIKRDDELWWAGVLDALPHGDVTGLQSYFVHFAEACCTDHRPVSWSPNAYDVVPRSAAALRRRLFAKACNPADPARSASALMLSHIDFLRDEHGTPEFGEKRHPDVSLGVAWPFEAEPTQHQAIRL